MRCRQRGGALLIAVVLIITVAAFAAMVTAQRASQDVQGSNAQADAIEALFLAESGIEQALKRFATGTACSNALLQNINDLSALGLGTAGRTIAISAGLTTDFSGATLPATQCRIPVTATITASGVSRTIHAIVDRNLLEGPDNPTFNNPAAAGAPSAWVFNVANPGTSFANTGGQDGTPACNRSIWLVKPLTNNYQLRATGAVPVNYTVNGNSATTVTFHYRVNDRGPNGTCLGGGAAAGPVWDCPQAGANDGRFCFGMTGAGGPWFTNTFSTVTTVNVNVACPDTGAITAFATCATGYPGAKGSVTQTMPAGGPFTVTGFTYYVRLQVGGRKELFLDNIEAVNNTAIGAARVQVWRDCSTATNPATCL